MVYKFITFIFLKKYKLLINKLIFQKKGKIN
jgi:hypothetical protein